MMFQNAAIGPLPTPEQQARIDAHWAKVRAGLHKPQKHDFSASETDVSHLIEMHRAIAMTCIRGGAKHAKESIRLSKVKS